MNGIILYADDDVLNDSSPENKLFQKFNNSTEHSVLPITNLEDLEKTISCISTFRALLLDWSFKKPKEDEDLPDMNEDPFELLQRNKIYSLIYIYSRESLPQETKSDLIDVYGKDKIFFEKKSIDFDENKEFVKICRGISDFEETNKQMEIPFIWSQSINKSAQTIFSELEQANPNWVKEIMETAKKDGAEPCSEVIDVFHNLLNELLIQDDLLRSSLCNYQPSAETVSSEKTAKLYRRLFYTKLTINAPVMTGDIFKFSDDEYGILITPECDIYDANKNSYEFLIINKDASNKYQEEKKKKYIKEPSGIMQIFNNGVLSRHILVSFPFVECKYDNVAVIDFSSAFINMMKDKAKQFRTSFKLNSPYIHQLRQRFIAYFGRYGVPQIPDSLKCYHLMK